MVKMLVEDFGADLEVTQTDEQVTAAGFLVKQEGKGRSIYRFWTIYSAKEQMGMQEMQQGAPCCTAQWTLDLQGTVPVSTFDRRKGQRGGSAYSNGGP